jgi:hypothetical protein
MIGDAAFTIIGETEEREPSATAVSLILGRGNGNLDVYIPLTTMTRRIGDQVITGNTGTAETEIFELSQMTLVVEDISKVEPTATITARLLQKSHNTPDYSIIVPTVLLRQASQLSIGARNDIVVVDLRRTRINDAELALVKILTDLEFLLLNDTLISDAGLNHLQGLRRMRAVWLRNTKVTDMGVSKLQQALPDCLIHR